jgi:hypothetical protein
MMYRKPTVKIMDKHILIELDGDFTDYEIRHLLNHAYLNHKAPHEYDEVKKYIRDLVIGKHNSVYVMNNGSPNPLASASIFYPDQLSTIVSNNDVNYDFLLTISTLNCGNAVSIGYTNNETCTSIKIESTSAGSIYISSVTGIPTYGYDNGTALVWELFYTNTNLTSIQPITTGTLTGTLAVGPNNPNYSGQLVPYNGIKYAYAPYLTSNNPLTLSTYYYWQAPSASFSYVYFNLFINAEGGLGSCSGDQIRLLVPIFYSQGNYSFNAGTYYLSMWQWTYS